MDHRGLRMDLRTSLLPLTLALVSSYSPGNTEELRGGGGAEGRSGRSGGYPATAYIQVIPQNVAAEDLQLVKTLMTSRNITDANSAIEVTRIQTSTVPGRVTLYPSSVIPGSDVRFEFSSREDVTNVRWFMVNLMWEEEKELHNGTKAAIVTSSRKSALSIDNIPRDWEGTYVCRFRYRHLQWQASHTLKFPLQSVDITPNPAHVLLWNNSTIFAGVTMECCISNDGNPYQVSWEPGRIPSDAVLRGDRLCYTLSITTVPEQDTYYRCVFQDSTRRSVESGVQIVIIKGHDAFCPDDVDKVWPATKAGHEAEILCPSGKRGRITRSCTRSGQWDSPKTSCVDARLLSLLEEVRWVRGGLGTPELEISGMMESLRNLALSSRGHVNNSWDIINMVEAIKTISLTALDNNMKFNFSAVRGLLEVYSEMLDKSLETIWMDLHHEDPAVASAFMQSIDNLTQLFEPDGNSFHFTIDYPNVEWDAVILSSPALTGYNKTFNTTQTTEVHMKIFTIPDHVMADTLLVTSMMLRNLGKILPARFGDSVGGYHHSVSNRIVINKVMTSGQSLRQVNLDMVFGRGINASEVETAVVQCVFWDYNLFEGVGGWSTEGCWTLHGRDGTTCRCNHLTSFSVLMSVGVLEDEYLETLSQVGVSCSILCLVITIIVYIVEWKAVVKNDISFYRQTAIINICLSLLIADVWFLSSTFIIESQENKLCISAAFFQHFFYLASFFWMLFHGLILFHQLVFVFHQLVRSIVIPSMVIMGYVCPLVIAVVTFILDYPKKAYIREGACFLNGENGAVFAFSGPVLLITFLNFFVIGVVVWRILRPPVSEGQEEDRKAMVARAIAILTSVFGVTWILGTLTLIEEAHEFFDYAFTLINSFQGVFILIFGCLLDKRVREAIYKRLQNLLSLFHCEYNSYNLEQNPGSDMDSVETYRKIEGS